MKISITLAALILLLSIVVYKSMSTDRRSVESKSPEISLSPFAKRLSMLSQEEKLAQHNALLASTEEKIDELKMKRLQSYAREADLARTFTPEITRRVIDAVMRQREPLYVELFSEWKLDKEKMRRVLAIIHDRETKLHDERMRSRRERPAEVGDLRDSGKEVASFEKSANTTDAINLAADAEILSVLGSFDRVSRIRSVEDDLKRKAIASAHD